MKYWYLQKINNRRALIKNCQCHNKRRSNNKERTWCSLQLDGKKNMCIYRNQMKIGRNILTYESSNDSIFCICSYLAWTLLQRGVYLICLIKPKKIFFSFSSLFQMNLWDFCLTSSPREWRSARLPCLRSVSRRRRTRRSSGRFACHSKKKKDFTQACHDVSILDKLEESALRPFLLVFKFSAKLRNKTHKFSEKLEHRRNTGIWK